jgi:hypothetical protein
LSILAPLVRFGWNEFLVPGEIAHRGTTGLLLGARTIPIDDVDKFPGISAELELKLTLFVDDQLGSRVEDSAALALTGIVQVKFAGGQVVGHAWAAVVGFAESDRAVGGESDLAAGWRGNQGNLAEVVAKCAGNGDAANWLHVGECCDQTLALALLKRIDEDLRVLLCRKLVDGHLDAHTLTHLGAGTHRGGVNRLCFPVICRDSRYNRCQEQRE